MVSAGLEKNKIAYKFKRALKAIQFSMVQRLPISRPTSVVRLDFETFERWQRRVNTTQKCNSDDLLCPWVDKNKNIRIRKCR
jgi:hypothetical protein